ncbi:MAG: DUF3297 family protein [Thermomonas sp.]|nr:DUF3297 family protein [Thermomonas sp.]
MTDASTPSTGTPPDRLSNDPRSPFYDAAVLERGIGIRFNGVERNNVEEYCISEGWVRMAAGRSLDRRGQPMTMKFKGSVEAWFLDTTGRNRRAGSERAADQRSPHPSARAPARRTLASAPIAGDRHAIQALVLPLALALAGRSLRVHPRSDMLAADAPRACPKRAR